MEQFFQFVIEHWFLWAAFVILIVLLILNELRTNVGGVTKVSPQNATHLINREKAVVIDIRDQAVFQDGHITGAVNIPLKNFSDQKNKLQKYKKRPIILVDVQGQQAAKVGAQIVKDGFDNVCFLQGGIVAWRNASLPLIKG